MKSYEFFNQNSQFMAEIEVFCLGRTGTGIFWANFDIFKRSCLCLYMAYLECAGSFLSTGLPLNAHPGPGTAHSGPELLKYTNGGLETAAIFLINQGWSF